jgi:tight adherence protein C
MTGAVHPALLGALLGLAAGLGSWLVVWRLASRRITLDDRLAPYLRARPTTSRLLAEPRTRTPFPTAERLVAPVLDDAARLLERLGSTSASIRRRIALAGSASSLEQFRLEQVLWATAGLAVGVTLALLVGLARGFSVLPLLTLVLLAALGGAFARDRALTRAVRAREERMVAEFPTVAELLALAVGAGESAVAALERVASSTSGELATELRRTLADARSGTPLARALENMADRTSLPSIVRFTEGVSVAVERGSPLADVLRAQAHDARDVGRRRLMETGGRKEVLMMVPVVFLILPVTVLFAIFPGLTVLRVGL